MKLEMRFSLHKILLIVILLLLILLCSYLLEYWNKYQEGKWLSTMRRLNTLARCYRMYTCIYENADSINNINDAVKAFSKDSFIEKYLERDGTYYEYDAWGEEIQLIKRPKIVIFRSKGRNRIDDNGNNDDIETTVDVPTGINSGRVGNLLPTKLHGN